MAETRIPLFVVLAEDIGEGAAFILEGGFYVPNPNVDTPEPLVSVGFSNEFTFSVSVTQVGLDTEDPDEGRILPHSRYIEVNTGRFLQLLVDSGEFAPFIPE